MDPSRRRKVLFVALVVMAVPVVAWLGLPWPWVLRWANPSVTSFMLYRERQAARADEDYALVHEWVPLEEIPDVVVRAVLSSEDQRFRVHHGVDWRSLADEVHWTGDTTFTWVRPRDLGALWRALRYYRAHRGEIKGRSTLTQQLAKNLFFTPERSLMRKAEEFVVARRLEGFLGKDRILELYLNTAELGPGLFGVGAAAKKYFGVPIEKVDRRQAAALAATLPQPLTSNPGYRPRRMAWRRDLILARMAGRDVAIPDEAPPVELPPVAPDLDLGVDTIPVKLPPVPASASVPDTARQATDTTPPMPDTTTASPDTTTPAR